MAETIDSEAWLYERCNEEKSWIAYNFPSSLRCLRTIRDIEIRRLFEYIMHETYYKQFTDDSGNESVGMGAILAIEEEFPKLVHRFRRELKEADRCGQVMGELKRMMLDKNAGRAFSDSSNLETSLAFAIA